MAFSMASPSRAPPRTAAEPATHRKPLRSAALAHRATLPTPHPGTRGDVSAGLGGLRGNIFLPVKRVPSRLRQGCYLS